MEPRVIAPRDMETRDMEPKDRKPRDTEPRDIEPRDMELKDIEPRDIEPRDIEPRDMKPRVVEPRNMKLDSNYFLGENKTYCIVYCTVCSTFKRTQLPTETRPNILKMRQSCGRWSLQTEIQPDILDNDKNSFEFFEQTNCQY
jgi:hypothetical protein